MEPVASRNDIRGSAFGVEELFGGAAPSALRFTVAYQIGFSH
jgi:hypothetical protein